MGFFDKLDKFYRNNFVSHLDKYKEKHGAYMASALNKIYKNEYNPYEFPEGLKKSSSMIPNESELSFLNGTSINTISLCENLAILCFCHNFSIEGGVDDIFRLLAKRISTGSENKLSENQVFVKLKDCSNLYKQIFKNDLTFPHYLNIYFDGWDVETEGHLDNVFKSFYLIQGNVLFISRHSLNIKKELVSEFFKQKNYRFITEEEHLYEEKYIRILSNNLITQNHFKLLQSEMTDQNWNYRNLLEIVKNIAQYSGYNEQQAISQYNELISQLDKSIYNWSELTKLGMLFLNFPNYSGEFNVSQIINLTAIIYRTEMVKI
jgi:hypothetical protein